MRSNCILPVAEALAMLAVPTDPPLPVRCLFFCRALSFAMVWFSVNVHVQDDSTALATLIANRMASSSFGSPVMDYNFVVQYRQSVGFKVRVFPMFSLK